MAVNKPTGSLPWLMTPAVELYSSETDLLISVFNLLHRWERPEAGRWPGSPVHRHVHSGPGTCDSAAHSVGGTELFLLLWQDLCFFIILLPDDFMHWCGFQEFDFHVRWPGVKLLTALLKNQGVQVQGIILVSPMGEFLLSRSIKLVL